MLWVVIGHSPLSMDNMPVYVETLYMFAYSFHMPLFIFVSGYLFYLTRLKQDLLNGGRIYTNYNRIISDKLIRLGVPFVVFTLIAFLMKVLFAGDMARQTALGLREFVMAIIDPFDGPNNEMWFIGTLLWLFALVPLWRLSFAKTKYEITLFIILLLLHLYHPNTNLFCIRQVCNQALFFFAGILICKHSMDEYASNYKWLLFVGGVIIYILSKLYGQGLGAACGAIAFSVAIAFMLDKWLPRIFFTFRNYTYQIFLMGIFCQIAVKMLFKRVDMPYIAGFLLCVIVGLYIPVIVSKLLEKINWSPLLICVGLRKK